MGEWERTVEAMVCLIYGESYMYGAGLVFTEFLEAVRYM